MCGRYTLTIPIRAIGREIQCSSLAPDFLQDWRPKFNIAPSQWVPVIRELEGVRTVSLLRWGLIPRWAKDESIAHQLINARMETLLEKPSFKEAFSKRRCLIPADGFYEWKREGSGKTPLWIHKEDRSLLLFGGIWERWPDPSGKTIETFAVITSEASGFVRSIHDRMPLIVSFSDVDRWLDPSLTGHQVHGLLRPYGDEDLTAHPVSHRVNSPRIDDPGLIDPSGQLSLGI